jgi:hypothetical protein
MPSAGCRWLAIRLLAGQPKKERPITLQNHGDAAWFGDIKIRELDL